MLRRFENSDDFLIVKQVYSDAEMTEAIVAGQARVAIKIPEDYSRRLLAGEPAQVQVLVDGTVSSVAAEALNVGNAIALRDSLMRAWAIGPSRSRPARAFCSIRICARPTSSFRA